MLRSALILFACFLAVGVSACSEREQSVSYQNGKYRGKPDGRPWESQPPPDVRSEWAKGDRYGWEKQMRARNDGQNENHRIGH